MRVDGNAEDFRGYLESVRERLRFRKGCSNVIDRSTKNTELREMHGRD